MAFEETSWKPEAEKLGFTSEEDMLRALYLEQALPISKISKLIGYSTYIVRVRLHRLGVPIRRRGGCNTDKITRALAGVPEKELFSMAVLDLVDRYGVHPSTVSAERAFRKRVNKERMERV